MKRIAVFASGSGSNAENLVKYFADSDLASVSLILSNNPNAKVLDRAKRLGVPSFIFTNKELGSGKVLEKLKGNKIDFIVLAGFLRKVPEGIIENYPDRIVNIHPALLPDYGGKGMYGMRVHEAVVDNEEEETGITIHYVNAEYDEGDIIFQYAVDVDPEDSPADVAAKVHELEYDHFPAIVEELLMDLDMDY